MPREKRVDLPNMEQSADTLNYRPMPNNKKTADFQKRRNVVSRLNTEIKSSNLN